MLAQRQMADTTEKSVLDGWIVTVSRDMNGYAIAAHNRATGVTRSTYVLLPPSPAAVQRIAEWLVMQE